MEIKHKELEVLLVLSIVNIDLTDILFLGNGFLSLLAHPA